MFVMSENNLPERAVRWTQKLLDLSLRNRLLNVRDVAEVVPLACRDLALVEDRLADGRPLPFRAGAAADETLSSALTEAETDKRLKKLFRAARSDLEESGSNTLFLALGFLRWTPGGKDAKTYRAPLLLLPVRLVRTPPKGFRLERLDEETLVNATLVELLRSQYRIEVKGVDPLPADEHGIATGQVLDSFRAATAALPGWEVTAEAALGRFSFGKFVMWRDLTGRLDALMRHPLVRHVISGDGAYDDGVAVFPPEEIAAHLDPRDLYCPLSADSSQLTAVLYSAAGKSFVLHGPPGTGKSQTIANLIAHNLAHGRRVLFVAEKKAALDVVHARLTKIGLRPFCLELHSNKSGKAEVLAQFAEALAVPALVPSPERDAVTARLDEIRRRLGAYVTALHRAYPNGLTPYDCFSAVLAQGEKQGGPWKLDYATAAETRAELDARRDAAVKLAHAAELAEPAVRDALGAVRDATWTPERERRIRDAAERLAAATERGFISRVFAAFKTRDVLDWRRAFALDRDGARQLVQAVPRARDVLAWRQAAAEAARLGVAATQEIPAGTAAAGFDAAHAAKMLDEILTASPELAAFSAAAQDELVRNFCEADEKATALAREAAAQRLSDRMPFTDAKCPKQSELGILRHECEKKMRQKPIRQLLKEIPTLAPQLKPCFLMSPLSVAQYLSPDTPPFDLVVFDEASQIPVWDAIGVIARGKALVVVGDPKQMPPTNFFQKGEAEDEGDDAEAAEDLESILDECIAAGLHSAHLNWHYRSRHESLIAFSNHHYYGDRLYTFPTPSSSPRLGVRFEFVEGGVYDRRATRTNRREAEALVDYVFAQMKAPDYRARSLGVVAFSEAQASLIADVFEKRREADPSLEARFADNGEEPFFVKNLENVQGDERDVILFSVGYAPDAGGAMAMNFGPLNRDGGERRLNVAITRAKEQVVVFSSIHASQIDLSRTSATGAAHLKAFLEFAERGSVAGSDAGAGAGSAGDFPRTVAAFLRGHGYEVDEGVGSGCCRIDLGVRRPDGEGYLLGIECDGPAYARQLTVRDRDELRPSVLKSLGWHLVRLWAPDWALDRRRAEESLLAKLKGSDPIDTVH